MFERLAGYFKYAKKNENQTSGLFRVRDDDDLLSSTLSLLTHMTELKLDARRVARIIQDADSGDPREQAELFATLQEKEPIIGAHLQTRRLAVMGCPLHIDSKKHPKEAEAIQEMLQKAGLRTAISALLDAIGTGYAGVAVDWSPGGAAINGFVGISPTAWVFDDAGNPALYSISGPPKPLVDFHPAQVLYIVSEGKAGLPCRKGLLRALLWMFLFKNAGFREWNLFLERFGTPFIMGAIPPNEFTNSKLREDLIKSLMSIRGAGVGVGTTETKMDILNGAAAGNKDAFEALQRYCDEIITLVILGQLASSDKAGGLSRGTAQDKVRQDILESDALMVQDALQNLVAWYCRLRHGWTDADDITVVIDYQPPEDLKTSAEMFSTLANAARRPLDPQQIFEKFGVKLGEPEPVPNMLPNEKPEQKEFADTTGKKAETASERIINATLARMVDTEALEAWRIPIDAAIRQAFGDLDPEDPELLDKFRKRAPAFLASLPGLMDEFETSAFEDALQGAMLAGFLNGALPAGFWRKTSS